MNVDDMYDRMLASLMKKLQSHGAQKHYAYVAGHEGMNMEQVFEDTEKNASDFVNDLREKFRSAGRQLKNGDVVFFLALFDAILLADITDGMSDSNLARCIITHSGIEAFILKAVQTAIHDDKALASLLKVAGVKPPKDESPARKE